MMGILGPEEGHYTLALACVLAVSQGIFPFLGRATPSNIWAHLTPSLVWSHCTALLISFVCLVLAALRNDFSVQNIAENSSRTKPFLYKITGIWSNHEGSILLWLIILSLCAVGIAYTQPKRQDTSYRFHAHLLGILGLISAGFDLFCLFTSNPFTRLIPTPSDGQGMSPLLQDPSLAFHPPLLYMGYVGFSVPFAYAISALITPQIGSLWGHWVRPWIVTAWAFLTGGITLGSWWSYYVLGWGGYWFWDPVENAALIPWLTGTALLHTSLVVAKRNSLYIWAVLLAIMTFSFSLSGTFLVRSGILNSVHAFANDPTRGVFIFILLALTVGSALILFAWRAPLLSRPDTFFLLSRESALVFNNIFLCSLCAVILTGTLYPPFIQLLFGHTLSVGKPFFDSTVIPLSIPCLLLMGGSLTLPWRRASPRTVFRHLRPAIIIALLACFPAFYIFPNTMAAFCAVLALWVISSSTLNVIQRLSHLRSLTHFPCSAWGATLAHIGMSITILGICGMSTAQHTVLSFTLGQQHSFAGYEWKLTGISPQQSRNYQAQQATLLVRHHEHIITLLHPSLRTFTTPHQIITHIAIHTSLIKDLYAVLSSIDHDHNTTHYIIRLHHNPLAAWIWIGGGIMIFGGLLTLSSSRKRKRLQHSCF